MRRNGRTNETINQTNYSISRAGGRVHEPGINRPHAAHARRIPRARATLPYARGSGKPEIVIRAAKATYERPVLQIRTALGASDLSGLILRLSGRARFAKCTLPRFRFTAMMLLVATTGAISATWGRLRRQAEALRKLAAACCSPTPVFWNDKRECAFNVRRKVTQLPVLALFRPKPRLAGRGLSLVYHQCPKRMPWPPSLPRES